MSDKEIYDLLYAKTKPKKISEIIGVSLWRPSSPDLNSFDYTIFSKTKQMQLPIQVLVHLRLLLRRNGIK